MSTAGRGCYPEPLPGFSMPQSQQCHQFLPSPEEPGPARQGGERYPAGSAHQREVTPLPSRDFMALFPQADDTSVVATTLFQMAPVI